MDPKVEQKVEQQIRGFDFRPRLFFIEAPTIAPKKLAESQQIRRFQCCSMLSAEVLDFARFSRFVDPMRRLDSLLKNPFYRKVSCGSAW